MVISLVSHAILTLTQMPYRLRIAIGTPITTIFCATLILTRYDDWNFIMQHRRWDVLVICSLCSAAVFYVVEGWFWMYRQALFDPDTKSGG
jgi:hypothetical protein